MDIVIGVTNCNYEDSRVKPWLDSINKNTNAKSLLIKTTSNEKNIHLYVYRFFLLYDFLYRNLENIDNVIITDVFDVKFQKDPFEWMKSNLKDKKIVLGSEGIKYKDETWGKNNLILSFGQDCYEEMKNNTIYCAGVLAGKPKDIADLCYSIYTICESKNLISEIKGGGAADQAALNFIVHNSQGFKDITHLSSLEESFVCHCGTSLAIPHYDSLLVEKKPIVKNNKIYTFENKEYTIIHQYNRINLT